jgi:DNA-binding protein HU-beta
MHKSDIVRSVAKETRLSQDVVREVLTASLDAITAALSRGQMVVLPGFGTFYTKDRKASQVRHFRTGEVISIPAMPQADFRVGELLRQAVRRGTSRGKRRGRPATTGS